MGLAGKARIRTSSLCKGSEINNFICLLALPVPQLIWDQVQIPFSYSCADFGPLGTTSLASARKIVKTLNQRMTYFGSELSRPYFNSSAIYILTVQKVWNESKKVLRCEGTIRIFPAEDLLIILCDISLSFCCCFLSPLESLKLGY